MQAPAPPSPSSPPSDAPLRIGLFDSGVGGLSVLRVLRMHLPGAHLIYLADSGHAPYGERSTEYLLERSRRITHHLLETLQCQGMVIPCNTATAAAIQALRAEWPGVPMVGVEPGVKPAVALSTHQRIGVMATTATLQHPRFHALVQAHAATSQVMAQPCPGLALAIEQGDLLAPEIRRLLTQYCGQLRDKQVDTVVLGCTHYAFVHDQIQTLLGPGVRLVDTAEAVALQAVRRFEGLVTSSSASSATPDTRQAEPSITLLTTADPQQLHDIASRWLGLSLPVRQVAL